MSAEMLRRAAALMRQNAEKAEPGRWKTWGMDVLADPKGTSDLGEAIPVALGCCTPSTSERRLHTGNVDHIASWHPAVALAVADWLDREAEIWEAVLVRAVQYAPKVEITIGLSTHEQATAVAAAYLGESPP